MPDERVKYVSMGQIGIARSGEILTTLLGSCIGVGLLVPGQGLCGLVHCVLPYAPALTPEDQLGRYVDAGIPYLLSQLALSLADYREIEGVLIGGSKLIRELPSARFHKDKNSEHSNERVGQRNIETAHKILKKNKISIKIEDTGGLVGRLLSIDSQTGKVTIRFVGEDIA